VVAVVVTLIIWPGRVTVRGRNWRGGSSSERIAPAARGLPLRRAGGDPAQPAHDSGIDRRDAVIDICPPAA